MASSPSRAAAHLADSQDLDARIGEEMDALRDKIEVKNREIESKTKDLNRLVTENRELQLKLDLITNPATQYSLIVDQGGGSFTAYLFAKSPEPDGKSCQLEKYKSVQLNDLADPELSSAIAEVLGGTNVHAADGTINDYSHVDPKHFALITRWFAAFYKNLEAKISQSYGELSHRSARQTGKIRARLMSPGAGAEHQVWCDAFHAALGPDWDYKLLTNADEARIEGEAFYHFNEKYLGDLVPGQFAANQYVGIGIGSSSTQAYVQGPHGGIAVGFDSEAGAKPTKAQAAVRLFRRFFSQRALPHAFSHPLARPRARTSERSTAHKRTHSRTSVQARALRSHTHSLPSGRRLGRHVRVCVLCLFLTLVLFNS
jgi:hypothetical protein